MINPIVIFCVIMVVFKDIYVSGTSKITYLKPEEINTSIECNPGFNGTLSCYVSESIHSRTTHCTVHCTSSDWTYFYLTGSNLYDNKTTITYVSPMTPMKISVDTSHIKCADGYNINKICFSKGVNLLSCKVNCTSSKESYAYETNMILP